MSGDVEAQPIIPCAGEVFDLRKLLPATSAFDFNIHVMDFNARARQPGGPAAAALPLPVPPPPRGNPMKPNPTLQPGEYLYVKEVHYQQHGLMLLEGQGIYRLADSWCGRTADGQRTDSGRIADCAGAAAAAG